MRRARFACRLARLAVASVVLSALGMGALSSCSGGGPSKIAVIARLDTSCADCFKSACGRQLSACENDGQCVNLANCYESRSDRECESDLVGHDNHNRCREECPQGDPCEKECLSRHSPSFERLFDLERCEREGACRDRC